MRHWVLFAGAALLLVVCVAWMGQNGPIGSRGGLFMGVYLGAFAGWLSVWVLWPRGRGQIGLLWALAIATRLLMLPFPVGDDVFRYVWEGQIQVEGFNPYRLAPDAPELEHLRDEGWRGINHKEIPAIYPPLAQLVFRATANVWADGRSLRLVFTAADLVTLLLLSQLAQALGLARRHLVLYALNPIVLVYVAGEAHLDPLYLVFLIGALLAHARRRPGLAFLLLGFSIMAKLVALLFLPLFVWRRHVSRLVWVVPPFLLVTPYVDGITSGAAVLERFVTTFYYNGFLLSLLRPLIGRHDAIPVCWGVFILGLAAIWLLVPNVLRATYLAAGLLLLTMPTVHQWYFLLMATLLPLFRSPGWLLLCGTVAATFATRITQHATGEWHDYAAARLVEYAPLVAAGIVGLWTGRRLGPWSYAPVSSVSVVIPVLDERDRLVACIEALRAQTRPVEEIIVVDGGSTDGSLEVARAEGDVTTLEARGGRGGQVAAGTARARGDAVLVLHADSRLVTDAVERLMRALNAAPHAAGGAFDADFENGSGRLRIVTTLNRWRARFAGISFGDQGQFFRRSALRDGFPPYALMEDVELSLRLQEEGTILFLSRGLTVSARRWNERGTVRNAARVISFVVEFLLRRRLGLVRDGGARFYRRYYGRPVPA